MDEIFQHYRQDHREDLIPCMQEVQDRLGYMSEGSIAAIGAFFSIPATKVYGLATFYDYFTFAPQHGDVIRICNGTSCHMQGAGKLIAEAEKAVQQIGSTSKRRFSLKVCECQGACSVGPVMQVNEKIHIRVKTEEVREHIRRNAEIEGGGSNER